MIEAPEEQPERTHAVELISDGENLLVLGEDRRSVERFLRSIGLLEKAREIGRRNLVAALRTSADMVKTISDTVAESSLWLKVTPESADIIKKYGLMDSGIPGVAYAMVGARGSIQSWITVDSTWHAAATNPGVLAGAAGVLSQAARQEETAQLRELLEALDQKLDQVIRGQKDDILGDLGGIERQIRVTMKRLETEGDVDALTWSTLFGTSVGLRQVQEKALLKLQGIAHDLKGQKRFGDLNQQLQEARAEVRQWLSVVARCVAALDELAVLELDYCAVLEPHRFAVRRATLDVERQDDRVELDKGVAVLLQCMDETARTANQNKIFHAQGVTKALDAINEAQNLVKRVYEAFGVDIRWESVDPVQWRDAIQQWQQWKNGLSEGGSLAWEKGKPVLGMVALTTIMTVVTAAIKENLDRETSPDA